MSIKIPYVRKKISTLLTISAIALLISSPMLFFNFLLQPVQAQTTLSFQTAEPAVGIDNCLSGAPTLTFHARGTTSSSLPIRVDITDGTFNVTKTNAEQYSGNIQYGEFINRSGVIERVKLFGTIMHAGLTDCTGMVSLQFQIDVPQCSTSNDGASSTVTIGTYSTDQSGNAQIMGNFKGVVECSQGVGGTQSSSMTGTEQDSDSDGIPDSSDRCTHNSNHRCFKEGEASNTTTQQQQPSSSSGTGNQTKG